MREGREMAARKSVLAEMAELAASDEAARVLSDLPPIPPPWVYDKLPPHLITPVVSLIVHGVDAEKLRRLLGLKKKPGKKPSKKAAPSKRVRKWADEDHSILLEIHDCGVAMLRARNARVTQIAALEAACLAHLGMPRREALKFAKEVNRRMSEAKELRPK